MRLETALFALPDPRFPKLKQPLYRSNPAPRGTEFWAAETGRQNHPKNTDNIRRDEGRNKTLEIPRKSGPFPKDDGFCGLEELDGGVGSQIRTGLRPKFPANREINREFYDFAAFGSGFSSKNPCAAAVFRCFP